MTSESDWKDIWKLDIEGHSELWKLHQNLRREMKEKWLRAVPFADELFDRWERAKFLGFGKGTSVYDSCLVLGDVRVGEETWIGPFTILDGRGGLSIGSYCSVSAGVQLYSHDTVKWALTGGKASEVRQSTSIGDCCYIGPMSIINRGVIIGDHSVVGANSFVKEDVPAFSIVAGNPAKTIGRVEKVGESDVRFIYEKERS